MELNLRAYTSPCESSLDSQWLITHFGVHGGLLPVRSPAAGCLWEQAEKHHCNWLQHTESVPQKHKKWVWGCVLPCPGPRGLWSSYPDACSFHHIPGWLQNSLEWLRLSWRKHHDFRTIMFLACSLGPSSCGKFQLRTYLIPRFSPFKLCHLSFWLLGPPYITVYRCSMELGALDLVEKQSVWGTQSHISN